MSKLDEYKLIRRNIPVYDCESDIVDEEEEPWILVDGELFSRKWDDEIEDIKED